jgi:hypothetical protein
MPLAADEHGASLSGSWPHSLFDKNEVRKYAKAVYDDTKKVRILFGFFDGAIISYSLFKLCFDYITPSNGDSSADMQDWMATAGGFLAAGLGTISIIAMSMIGNAFDDDKKNPLVRGIAMIWPYLRDAFKALKFAYKGVRTTLMVLGRTLGSDLKSMLVPLAAVIGIAAAANRVWYRCNVTEARKDYQKKNNTLYKRALHLVSSDYYDLSEMADDLSEMPDDLSEMPDDLSEMLEEAAASFIPKKLYIKVNAETQSLEYQVYAPSGKWEKDEISFRDLGFRKIDQNGQPIQANFENLKAHYGTNILAEMIKKGHIKAPNDEANRQAIRAEMDDCCSIHVEQLPSAPDFLQSISPFTAAYVRIHNTNTNQLYYFNKTSRAFDLICENADKLSKYDEEIKRTNSPKVLTHTHLRRVLAVTGHQHKEKQYLPNRSEAIASAVFGGFVDGLYTYMGIFGVVGFAGFTPPIFAALAVCCTLFTILSVVSRYHEEEEFHRDYLRSRANVELILLVLEMQDALAKMQNLSLKVLIARENQTQRANLAELQNKQRFCEDTLMQKLEEFEKKKEKYQDLKNIDNTRAVLMGIKNGMYIYSAISSIVFAISAFYAVALTTFPPIYLIAGISLGIASVILSVWTSYTNNAIKNDGTCVLRMEERPSQDFSNIPMGLYNRGYIRVRNTNTQTEELFYVDKRKNIFLSFHGRGAKFLTYAPKPHELEALVQGNDIFCFRSNNEDFIGFMNESGECEKYPIGFETNQELLNELHSLRQNAQISHREILITDEQFITLINLFLTSTLQMKIRVRDCCVGDFDRIISGKDKPQALSQDQLETIKHFTGNIDEDPTAKLRQLIARVKKSITEGDVDSADPLKELAAFNHAMYMDNTAQAPTQEISEFFRSMFSGVSKGPRFLLFFLSVFKFILGANVVEYIKSSQLQAIFGTILSVIIGVTYALRSFGKHFRGPNDADSLQLGTSITDQATPPVTPTAVGFGFFPRVPPLLRVPPAPLNMAYVGAMAP